MGSRRELFNLLAMLILGVLLGVLGSSSLKHAVGLAEYAGNDYLGASLMEYQRGFFEKNQRYPATICEIDQTQLRFGDGATGEIIDEMVYFCDSSGSRFLAILGKGPHKVELTGVGGKVSFNAWDKHAERKLSR